MHYRKGNIHGHLHGNNVWLNDKIDENNFSEIGQNCINVCVEHTDWKPISFDELINN